MPHYSTLAQHSHERTTYMILTAYLIANTILIVQIEPTRRQLRILQNLRTANYIWEKAGAPDFVQFDETSGKELRLKQTEVMQMAASGWIRRVQHPPSAQRLDRYELADNGIELLEDNSLRKGPARENVHTAKPAKQA